MEKLKSETKVSQIDLKDTAYTMRVHAVISAVKRLKGKYAKQVLTRFEADGTITPAARKHVLDGFNDLDRELLEMLHQLFN